MVGGGPAGCAAAIVLAQAGMRVVVLERSRYEEVRVGETLAPEIRVPLERLGAWDKFCAGGKTPSPGILAAWGQPEPYSNDFIVNPYGSGWQVDRRRFDKMLASVAEDVGAVVYQRSNVRRCARFEPGTWQLLVADGDAERSAHLISAAFLIDATGRTPSLLRHLGARQIVHDRLVSAISFMAPVPRLEPHDQRALIESTEHGWWYSAWLPDGTLVVALQTDAGSGLRARWNERLAAAPYTSARARGFEAGKIRLVAANSRQGDPVAAPLWLGVGDAAASHDPISGLGVYWALESGMAAGDALVARAGGDSAALSAYAAAVREAYDRYLNQWSLYYRAERRWPDAQFWRRRQQRRAPVEA